MAGAGHYAYELYRKAKCVINTSKIRGYISFREFNKFATFVKINAREFFLRCAGCDLIRSWFT